LKVSVILIVKDEEENIEECLESVSWVSDVVVVDANSSDRTVEKCLNYTSRVFSREWNDDYASQKNYALSLAKNEWILNIDADERVSEQLKTEIEKLDDKSEYNAYFIPFKHKFFGKWLRHGGYYPGYKLRLFKKANACYVGRVHEDLKIIGGIRSGCLNGHIDHNMVVSYSKKLKKSNYYSSLAAEEEMSAIAKGESKWRKLNLIYKPLRTFIYGYFILQGFIDGWPGLICHIHNAFGEFSINAKIYERMLSR
jgi:glycosyltransferase involved in cell wall biosynthesis